MSTRFGGGGGGILVSPLATSRFRREPPTRKRREKRCILFFQRTLKDAYEDPTPGVGDSGTGTSTWTFNSTSTTLPATTQTRCPFNITKPTTNRVGTNLILHFPPSQKAFLLNSVATACFTWTSCPQFLQEKNKIKNKSRSKYSSLFAPTSRLIREASFFFQIPRLGEFCTVGHCKAEKAWTFRCWTWVGSVSGSG